MLKAAIFDLDSTLIDTQIIKKRLFDFLMEAYNFSKDEVKEIYENARVDNKGKNTFSLERLEKVIKDGDKKLAKWFEKTEMDLLIEGVDKILSFFRVNKIPIYILTLGVKRWQLDKIKKSGLGDLLTKPEKKNIKFTDEEDSTKGKEEEIRKILKELKMVDAEGIVFFNDKPDETEKIWKKWPAMRVIIRREFHDSRYAEEDYERLAKMGAEVYDDLDIIGELKNK